MLLFRGIVGFLGGGWEVGGRYGATWGDTENVCESGGIGDWF